MNNVTITTKVDSQTKKAATQTAKELGMSLNNVMEQLLRQFVRTKTLNITDNYDEEPNEYMIEQLRLSEEDEKAGRVSPPFSNVKDAITWLDDPNATYENGDKVQRKI